MAGWSTLGPGGSAASTEYDRVVAEWLANGRSFPAADSDLMARVRSAFAEMPTTLRKTYSDDLAALEHRAQPSRSSRINSRPAERLRAIYCRDLDTQLSRG